MDNSIVCEPVSAGEAIGSYKKFMPAAIAVCAVGGAGLIAYIVLSTIFGGEGIFDEPPWVSAFLVFAVPFTVGLIFALSIRSMERMRENLKDNFYACEFFSDCFLITESKGGEQLSVRKEFYENIVRVKIKNGCLLAYANDAHLVPARISGLSAEQLNTLKKLMRLPVAEGAKVIELRACDKL